MSMQQWEQEAPYSFIRIGYTLIQKKRTKANQFDRQWRVWPYVRAYVSHSYWANDQAIRRTRSICKWNMLTIKEPNLAERMGNLFRTGGSVTSSRIATKRRMKNAKRKWQRAERARLFSVVLYWFALQAVRNVIYILDGWKADCLYQVRTSVCVCMWVCDCGRATKTPCLLDW